MNNMDLEIKRLRQELNEVQNIKLNSEVAKLKTVPRKRTISDKEYNSEISAKNNKIALFVGK